MRKIRKYYTNKKINFSKSAVNFNKRKKNEMKSLKSSKEKKSNRNKELILNEDKISQNIFNNLDKIQKTLLLKYQQNYGMKDGNDMIASESLGMSSAFVFLILASRMSLKKGLMIQITASSLSRIRARHPLGISN
jgi:hypothetical protein